MFEDFEKKIAENIEQVNEVPAYIEDLDDDGLDPRRIGCITASRYKALMTKTSRKKPDWSSDETILDFGKTAETELMTIAMERLSGVRRKSIDTYALRFGKQWEPVARSEASNFLGAKITESEYKECLKKEGKGVSGATPDGESAGRIGYEIKCYENPINHFKAIESYPDETHEYFWQWQMQIVSGGYKAIKYVSFCPYLFESEKPGAKKLSLQIDKIEPSSEHIRAMIIRTIIGNEAIDSYLSNGRESISKGMRWHINEAINNWRSYVEKYEYVGGGDNVINNLI